MSEPPPRPPPPPDSLSLHGASSKLASRLDDTPPPPPPKPGGVQAAGSDGSLISTSAASGSFAHPSQVLPNSDSIPPPPSINDRWLPPHLADQTKPDLETLLSDPNLLDALIRAPDTAHPSLSASDAAVSAQLNTNTALAKHVSDVAAHVAAQRADVSSRLLQLRALERQWHLKQAAMDDALAPFSPKALHARLVAGIGEQENWLRAVEESFLEGEGRAGEREVAEFVKRWRDGKKILSLRAERKRRFDEGRVGGWR